MPASSMDEQALSWLQVEVARYWFNQLDGFQMIANSLVSLVPGILPRLAYSVRSPNSGAAMDMETNSLPVEIALRFQAAPISTSPHITRKSGWFSVFLRLRTSSMFWRIDKVLRRPL